MNVPTIRPRSSPRRLRSRAARAFTLIELLLVLVILGILAAVVVPKFVGRTEDAKKGAAKKGSKKDRAR